MTTSQPPAMSAARVLLVDDDPYILESLGSFLELEGYDVTRAASIERAVDSLAAGRYDLVITDVSLPASSGLDLLRHVRGRQEDVEVIVITGYGTIESAVEAMKLGAFDYLTKPIIDDDVRLSVERALQRQQLLAENRRLKQALSDRYSFDNILSADHRMAKIFEVIDAVAPTRTTVLITGESGTGKSLIARAIHARSDRRDRPFVEVSCGALPDTLLESELFGHLRGAFTHAVSDKPGKFAAAEGGSIFLDEIATASPQLQVKLLRVLQERQYEPLGSTQTQQANVRVLLATNHDLGQDVRDGSFREDLYYRINVVNIHLPPLRQRISDIPLLADHFLRKFQAALGKRVGGFSAQVLECLVHYPWPGNVRELENCIERAAVLCRGEIIELEDLPPALLDHSAPPPATTLAPAHAAVHLKSALAEPERQLILAALRANDNCRQAAARQLGINRATLYKKMKKLGIQA
ncbi:MAG: Transcriptional regulatory protein ZraR [Planctomycetes bacterium ADurb.Bin126]|nr:MAG: Transcriptional regulatory protein ZraR [Planctomycetes bacterium ADurb.Bin126]HOD83133.1 sigma-54 dependent transcriptional regulator [Phycisphaerae bacterium]HQL72480.1 sigma-54 dependent transcriptional regulator [Phycisphaerae bacterium]